MLYRVGRMQSLLQDKLAVSARFLVAVLPNLNTPESYSL